MGPGSVLCQVPFALPFLFSYLPQTLSFSCFQHTLASSGRIVWGQARVGICLVLQKGFSLFSPPRRVAGSYPRCKATALHTTAASLEHSAASGGEQVLSKYLPNDGLHHAGRRMLWEGQQRKLWTSAMPYISSIFSKSHSQPPGTPLKLSEFRSPLHLEKAAAALTKQ